MRLMLTLMLILLGAAMAALCQAEDEPLPAFSLWIKPGSTMRLDPSSVVDGHPCGQVLLVHVDTLPSFDENAEVQPERVLELDDHDRAIQTWVVPVDAETLGVDQDWLYFRYTQDVFKVNEHRQISRVIVPPHFPEPKWAGDESTNTSHCDEDRTCHWFQDLSTGKPHRLSSSMICS